MSILIRIFLGPAFGDGYYAIMGSDFPEGLKNG
jgi:hypothetical protein